MNKGNHSILQDENLREALRQNEVALPQMAADLNDRLMKRVHHEKRRRHYKVWPWVAAACVTAVLVVLLLPPRESGSETMTSSGESATQTNSIATKKASKKGQQETNDMESTTTAQEIQKTIPYTHKNRIAKSTGRNPQTEVKRPRLLTQPSSPVADTNLKEHSETAQNNEVLSAREKNADQPKEVTACSEMLPTDLPHTQTKPQHVVLTERDIPISRPENYRYTPEELALMRRQANEAYVKWMELELEIIKYQYEQVANQ